MQRPDIRYLGILAALSAAFALTPEVSAQIAISANDGKGVLIDGVNTVPDNPVPDNVAIIDLAGKQPKIIAEIEVPTSLVGPPQSVAIAPDKSFALVSAATKIDPANKKKTAPESKLSVIDLKAKPPAVIATHETGAGASGVSINAAGTLALVANRVEGTVSIFTIVGNKLTPGGKLDLGNPKSGPSAVAFTPDGKRALVTRDGDHKVSVLDVDGTKVVHSKRDIHAGLKPYPLEITRDGAYAVISNIGMSGGDSDTISLIDLKLDPPRAVDTVSVGQTPESIGVSPNGRYVAVTVMNGSNKPKASPFHKPNGIVSIYRISKGKLTKVTEAKAGTWCQGAGWSKDSKTLIVQCMVEQELLVYAFNGKSLSPKGSVKVKGGPGGLGVSRD
jgi:DNA-binding beta-propeller fold protein YncE